MKSGLCTRGGSRCRLIAAAKKPVDLRLDLRERTIGQRPARIDDDIPRSNQIPEPDAHHFADPSLKAIAYNGLANGSWRSNPEARTKPAPGQTKSCKQRPIVTEAVLINFTEFAGS